MDAVGESEVLESVLGLNYSTMMFLLCELGNIHLTELPPLQNEENTNLIGRGF